MQRRTVLQLAGSALAAPAAGMALAEGYPNHPITLMVPYAAGGNADLTARLFADALGKTIGQSVIVDNKAGGGGAIGALNVIGSRPDGHTLLFCATSVFSVTPQLVKVSYGPASVRPVGAVSKTPLVLVVKKGSKYKSLTGLIDAARASPSAVPLGYSGLGTPNHLGMLNLESVAKVRFNSIPYKGSGPMLQDLLAGQIEVGADQLSTSKPYMESGDLIPLALFGTRVDMVPASVPLVSSLGPELFDATTYLGVCVPAATPDATVAAIHKAMAGALQDQRFIAGMARQGSLVYAGSGQDFESIMRKEDEFMRQMISSGRVKPE